MNKRILPALILVALAVVGIGYLALKPKTPDNQQVRVPHTNPETIENSENPSGSDPATTAATAATEAEPAKTDDATDTSADNAAPTVSVKGTEGAHDFAVEVIGGGQKVSLSTPNFEMLQLPEGVSIRIEGKQGLFGPEGAPDLPIKVSSLQGKAGYRAVVKIITTEYEDYEDVDMAPRGNYHRTWDNDIMDHGEPIFARVPNNDVYGKDAFWPPSLADVSEMKSQDDHIVRVEYRPLQWNPETKTLRHHKSIEAVVSFEPIEKTAFKAAEGDFGVNFVSDPNSGTDMITNGCDCAERFTLHETYLPDNVAGPADFKQRFPGLDKGICGKILVNNTGIQRVTRTELIQAGVGPSTIIGGNIRMYTRDQEIAIFVSTSGSFGSSDFILFYGERHESFYTEDNAYWISFDGGLPGTAMRWTDSARNGAVKANTAFTTSACRQFTYREKGRFLDVNPRDEEYDGWVSSPDQLGINPWTVNVPFTDKGAGSAKIEVLSRPRINVNNSGLSNPTTYSDTTALGFFSIPPFPVGQAMPHRTFIVNNATGATIFDTGKYEITQPYGAYWHSQTVATGLLQNSAAGTMFKFDTLGLGILDLQYIDRFRIQFDRRISAMSNRIGFGGLGGNLNRNYRVEGVSGSASSYTLLDVTDPVRPVKVNLSGSAISGSNLQFGDRVNYDPCYFLSRDSAFFSIPDSKIEPVIWRDLADTSREVDYIAIMPEQWIENRSSNAGWTSPIYKLLRERAIDDNFRVLTAPIEDVYNEFGYGNKDAKAIQQFLGYAYHHYQVRPKYVILIGDAKYDSTDANPDTLGHPDLIPTLFDDTSFTFTSVEGMLAAVDGVEPGKATQMDIMPDLALGRYPVENLTDLNTVVEKTLTFDNYTASSAGSREIVLVADTDPPKNNHFKVTQNNFDNLIKPPSYTSYKLYFDQEGSMATMRSKFSNFINNNVWCVKYEGHGSFDTLARANSVNWWENSDVDAQTNSRLYMLTLFTCQACRFTHPNRTIAGLGRGVCEANLRATNGSTRTAAAVVIGATMETQEPVSEVIGEGYFKALMRNQVVTNPTIATGSVTFGTGSPSIKYIGDALLNGTRAAAISFGRQQEVPCYNIFGCPASEGIN